MRNVAQILRGYTYPTVTTEKYDGPASSYGPSILSQIGGLGSLIASGTNDKNTGFIDKALGYITGDGSGGSQYSNTGGTQSGTADQQAFLRDLMRPG